MAICTAKVPTPPAAPLVATQVFETLPLEGLPHLVKHIEYHVTTDEEPTDTSEFDFGLDLLLDGLERMREVHQ